MSNQPLFMPYRMGDLDHPRTCCSVHSPGVSAQPNPSGLIAVASAMISPAEARCA
jgi:hypothetical protein